MPPCYLLNQDTGSSGGSGPRIVHCLRTRAGFPLGTPFLLSPWDQWKDKRGINWGLWRIINYTWVKGKDRFNLPEINFPGERCWKSVGNSVGAVYVGSFPPLDSGFPGFPHSTVQDFQCRFSLPDLWYWRNVCLSPNPHSIYVCLNGTTLPPELFPNLPKLNIAPLGLGIIQCYVLWNSTSCLHASCRKSKPVIAENSGCAWPCPGATMLAYRVCKWRLCWRYTASGCIW